MDIMNYSNVVIEKSVGYSEHVRVEYKDESRKGNPISRYVWLDVTYNPETKETLFEKSVVVAESLKEQYERKFEDLCTKVFIEQGEKFSSIRNFYDKVYLFLHEEIIDLSPIHVGDVIQNNIRFAIDTYCEKYDFNVVLLLKDRDHISHVNIIKPDDAFFISIRNPEDYANLLAINKKIVEESKFRLQLLFDVM